MSLRTAIRRLPLRPAVPCAFSIPTHRRTFISLPGSEPQSLVATKTLPYDHKPLYELIADVDSYSTFVPYCSHSNVTKWSAPDSNGRRWPALADLHVGWGGFNEVFTSRLRCVPGVSVEALSGGNVSGTQQDASAVFKTLETLWSLRPISHQPSPSTEVRLTIKYQFVNPLYAVVSAAISDQMASLMIEAFEKQVHDRLGPHKQNLQ
ncbi:Coenzyme Q-binding protein coq10 [Cladobotryum mycophilum]|uniref:Coenzyme Q-binding protein coq10 n=1 Tax=Cladobotryum mycophilum TaxID=491253 RepID=A0ABR0SN10_9HYPO